LNSAFIFKYKLKAESGQVTWVLGMKAIIPAASLLSITEDKFWYLTEPAALLSWIEEIKNFRERKKHKEFHYKYQLVKVGTEVKSFAVK
jgi:hypothetical protein